jgi:large subunit ribosomal protein L25
MNLSAKVRDEKESLASLRDAGMMPMEMYGLGEPNAHLCIPLKDFEKIWREAGESSVVSVLVDGKKYPAMIHDVQFERTSGRPIHADLLRVRMDKKITAHVHLEFVGESPAEKLGAVVSHSMRELEVEALPSDMPHHIEVDLSSLLEVGSSLHVKDLKIEKGVKIMNDPEMVVASASEYKEVVDTGPVSVEEVAVEGEVPAEGDAQASDKEKTEEK